MGSVALEVLGKLGDPGAIGLLALLGVGAGLCFMGCRAFRFSSGVVGLVVGAELLGQLALHQGWGTVATVIAAVLGGAALCALFVVFPFLGVFGMGAVLAASLVSTAAHAALPPLWLVLTGLIGGFGALILKRPVVIVATALYGALAAMAAVFALSSSGGLSRGIQAMASPAQTGDVPLYLLCVAVLVTGGITVQFRYGGRNAALDGGKER